jgi:hypothetical protein
MSTEIPTTPGTPAEQAKALLAYAANDRHFYEPITWDGSRMARLRGDECSETAMYAAQAATAHALLAVVGELAALRADLQQQAAATREDLAGIAAEVSDLATALTEPLTAVSGSVDGLTGQVEAVHDAVEEGLDVVADTMTLLFDRRPRLWWLRLRSWRTRRHATRPDIGDGVDTAVGAAAMAHSLGIDTALPVVPAIPAGQDALERLAHLREVLADWAATLPDNPNRSGLRQGLAATLYEAWEATHAVIPKVVDSSVSGPVQDAVLRLGSALEEMGPAGVPAIEAVQAVSDRLTDLLKVAAAEAVTARAEVSS